MSSNDDIGILLRRKALELSREAIQAQDSEGCGKGIINADKATLSRLLSRCRIVVVDFWAEWCGPCRMVAPVIERLADKYTPMIGVAKVNVDHNQDLALEYDVMSIPTIIVFYRGKEYRRFVGYNPLLLRQLEAIIRGLL